MPIASATVACLLFILIIVLVIASSTTDEHDQDDEEKKSRLVAKGSIVLPKGVKAFEMRSTRLQHPKPIK